MSLSRTRLYRQCHAFGSESAHYITAAANPEWLGIYRPYFRSCNHDVFVGFYKDGYSGPPCSFSNKVDNVDKHFCTEGFLPSSLLTKVIPSSKLFFLAGVGLDTQGWNYTNRWQNIFEQNSEIMFVPIRDISHDVPGSNPPSGDILFTVTYNKKSTVRVVGGYDFYGNPISYKEEPVSDPMLTKAVSFVNSQPNSKDNNVLIGYSYGSVMVAHVALQMKNKPDYGS